MIGEMLGPYRVLSKLGEGGMGEVYRAHDTRLNRDVAIKVLPEDFAANADRLARFEREAQSVAAFSHPNIVALYDTGRDTPPGSDTPVLYAVTELLEGETLRARMTAPDGSAVALQSRKIIDIGVQIARGLAAAHDKGLVHRDLKPENVFLLADGQVKILDFGLARQAAGEPSGATETQAALTDPGVVMGTVGYMAPEQVRGQAADARTDLFAFGAVLYEMLTGRRAFQRGTSAETMTAILREDPPEIPTTPSGIPPALARVVLRCLEKNPAERFQSARDLAFNLGALSLDSGSGTGAMAAASARTPSRKGPLVAAAMLVLGALGGLGAGWAIFHSAPPDPPRTQPLTFAGNVGGPAVSPDGQLVAYQSSQGGGQIWIKQIDGGGEAAVTSGPGDHSPRFSPDGKELLFIRGSTLYRVPAIGGTPRRVLDDASSADWSPTGDQIVYAATRAAENTIGLVRPDGTGQRRLEQLEGLAFISVRWSPDGRRIASLVTPPTNTGGVRIRLTPTDGGPGRFLDSPLILPNGGEPIAWSRSGREVVYAGTADNGSLVNTLVVAHDITSGRVRRLFWPEGGNATVDVAPTGMLVFAQGTRTSNLRDVPVDAAGASSWLTRGSSVDRQPTISPDGQTVLFTSTRSGNPDLWTVSRATGELRRLTDHPAADADPAFMPDNQGILWSSNRSGHFEIWMASADGSGARQVSQDGVDAENPVMTPDGQWILYSSGNPAKAGIWKIRRDGTDAARLSTGSDIWPEVSPDGRLVAYVQFRPPQRAIVVATLDTGGETFRIPLAGGAGFAGRLRWMPDGKRIAFTGADVDRTAGIFVQDVAPGADTRATPRKLAGFLREYFTESFGIAPDGQSVLIAAGADTSDLFVAHGAFGLAARGGR